MTNENVDYFENYQLIYTGCAFTKDLKPKKYKNNLKMH